MSLLSIYLDKLTGLLFITENPETVSLGLPSDQRLGSSLLHKVIRLFKTAPNASQPLVWARWVQIRLKRNLGVLNAERSADDGIPSHSNYSVIQDCPSDPDDRSAPARYLHITRCGAKP